jgi:hypothetical protein
MSGAGRFANCRPDLLWVDRNISLEKSWPAQSMHTRPGLQDAADYNHKLNQLLLVAAFCSKSAADPRFQVEVTYPASGGATSL